MPVRPSTTRALAALVLLAASFSTVAPVPTIAADPPRPVPDYRPAFVTERQAGAWEDCTWAAAAMFLDKWTNGVTIVDRQRLRKLSGDREGGSNLIDVERAFAKLGFHLRTSPNGGESVTWAQLLDRLSHGGGAILQGDYGKLPRHYGRWDRRFWNQEGETDDHAMYLDRYDRATGKIFIMDPLAPDGWKGEWIRASALKKYAWRTRSGRLWVALTPPAAHGPLAGVEVGEPVLRADAAALHVTWPIVEVPAGWSYAGSTVQTEIVPVGGSVVVDPMAAIVAAGPAGVTGAPGAEVACAVSVVSDVPASSVGAVSSAPLASDSTSAASTVVPLPEAPATAASDVADGVVSATIPLPQDPGVYRLTVTVTDLRLGGQFATVGPVSLYVPGPRAAAFTVPDPLSAEPGSLVAISVAVRNVGTAPWSGVRLDPGLPLDLQRPRSTRLVGTWVTDPPASDEGTADTDDGAALAAAAPPPPVDFGSIALDTGYGTVIEALVRIPVEAGTWRLVIDIVDDQIGSLASTGSAPGMIDVEVFAPRPDSAGS